MKLRLLLAFLTASVIWILSVSTTRNPSNPPTPATNAPGEKTCSQQVGCHTGGNFTGTIDITGINGAIVPGTTYDITVKLSSSCSRAGFMMTALDRANAKAGTFVAGTGSNVTTNNANQRQYVRQSAARTLSGGSTTWTYKWTAPTSLTSGDSVSFYTAVLAANGNGGTSGDNALAITKTFKFDASTSVGLNGQTTSFELYPNPAKSSVNVVLGGASQGTLSLYDLQGKLVKHQLVRNNEQVDVSALQPGVYTATLRTGKEAKTLKVVIQ